VSASGDIRLLHIELDSLGNCVPQFGGSSDPLGQLKQAPGGPHLVDAEVTRMLREGQGSIGESVLAVLRESALGWLRKCSLCFLILPRGSRSMWTVIFVFFDGGIGKRQETWSRHREWPDVNGWIKRFPVMVAATGPPRRTSFSALESRRRPDRREFLAQKSQGPQHPRPAIPVHQSFLCVDHGRLVKFGSMWSVAPR
jgi:hypothetical protein